MSEKIIKERLRKLRSKLKQSNTTAFIITNSANVGYMTGFHGEDSWVLVTPRKSCLITDSRYTEQAEEEAVGCKVVERRGPIFLTAGRIITGLKGIKSVAIEDSTTVAQFKTVRNTLKVKLITTSGIVESLRLTKHPAEITAVKKAIAIAIKAFKMTIPLLKPGITENETASRLDLYIHRLGATSSFPAIVAFGANASRAHHFPGSRKLKPNDTVLIDWGVRYKNYCSDMTRCLVLNSARAFYRKVYEAVFQAQQAAIKAVRAGVKIEAVDKAAKDVLRGYDLPLYGHGTGHGLGLDVHEQPIVAHSGKGRLQSGQIITIEPGVYIPGRLGIRIEDDVLVTKDGGKILSTGLKMPEVMVL
ncbi:MAG: Xaa-Pro peptidase family protein [Planctomycetota bacterium]